MENYINPVAETLTRIRQGYTLVATRATRVRAVLEELATSELWLNYTSVREAVLVEGWGWAKDKYRTKADYAKVLDNDNMPDRLGAVEMVQGIKLLKLKPFAGDPSRLPAELGLQPFCYLGLASNLEMVRNVVVPPFRDGEESLCEFEMTILKKALHRRTLEVTNALRDIESSVKYLLSMREMGGQRKVPVAVVAESPTVDALLYRLLGEVTLGFQPEPSSFPSFQSERVNVLKAVPDTLFELENKDLMPA